MRTLMITHGALERLADEGPVVEVAKRDPQTEQKVPFVTRGEPQLLQYIEPPPKLQTRPRVRMAAGQGPTIRSTGPDDQLLRPRLLELRLYSGLPDMSIDDDADQGVPRSACTTASATLP